MVLEICSATEISFCYLGPGNIFILKLFIRDDNDLMYDS